MSMFDTLRCHYPLPIPEAQGLALRTKDLDRIANDYELRADGSLWVEDYDIEDRSDPNATGLAALAGALTRVNCRWRQVTDLDETIIAYGDYSIPRDVQSRDRGRVVFLMRFQAGHIMAITTVEDTKPDWMIARQEQAALEAGTPAAAGSVRVPRI